MNSKSNKTRTSVKNQNSHGDMIELPRRSPLRWQLLSANNKESINLIGVNQYPRCPIAQVEFYRHVTTL